MTNIAVVDINAKQPDELSFVDEDIRELFEGCSYIMGMPLLAQLIKELRLLRRPGKEAPNLRGVWLSGHLAGQEYMKGESP